MVMVRRRHRYGVEPRHGRQHLPIIREHFRLLELIQHRVPLLRFLLPAQLGIPRIRHIAQPDNCRARPRHRHRIDAALATDTDAADLDAIIGPTGSRGQDLEAKGRHGGGSDKITAVHRK